MPLASNVVVTGASPTLAATEGFVEQALNTAITNWSNYVAGFGSLIISLNFADLGSQEEADGGPTTTSPLSSVNGTNVYQTSSEYELTTGKHLAATDISLDFNTEVLPEINASTNYLVPVFEHELEHGLGMDSFQNPSTGTIGSSLFVFDQLSQFGSDGSDYFVGSAAERVYGGPVPLRSHDVANPFENYAHLGATGTSADPASLYYDIMGGGIYQATDPVISALDVAILSDLGIPLTAAGLAFIGGAANQTGTINAVYMAVLGRAATPAELAAGQQTLTNGGTLNTIRATVAASQEAASVINAAYLAALNRAAQASDIAGWQASLAGGSSVTTLHTTLGGSAEAASAINASYLALLGRAASQSDIAGWQANLSAGSSIAILRAGLAQGPEGGNAINAAYAAVLGRQAQSADVTGWQSSFANGGTLATLRATLGSSAEAASAVNTAYQTELGRSAQSADISGWQANLANGGNLSNLRALLAGSSEAASAINAAYQSELGRPARTADITGWQSNLANGGSLSSLHSLLGSSSEAASAINAAYQSVLGRPAQAGDIAGWQANLSSGSSLPTLQGVLAESSEAIGGVTRLFTTALGHAPTATQIDAGQSELLSGYSQSQLGAQYAALASNPASNIFAANTATVAITPEKLFHVYGLPDNVAFLSLGTASVTAATGGGTELDTISGFSPSTDYLLLPQALFSSFAAVQPHVAASAGGTAINVTNASEVFLAGISPTQLSAANFKFA